MQQGSSRSSTPDLEQRRFYLLAAGIAILALWIAPIRSSFWLDETGTWWVIKDGLHAVIDRAAAFQGQTPLFYVLEWLVRTVGGHSEIVLRLPSLLATFASAVLVYRIGRRIFDAEVAAIAVLVFAVNPNVVFAASDARPYALAMLALTASTLALVRWLDEGRRRDAIVYVLLVTLMIYVHYVFAPAIGAHAIYAYARRRHIDVKTVLAVGAGIGALLAPAAPQLLTLFHRRASLSVPSGGYLGTLFSTVAPPLVTFAAAIGVLAATRSIRLGVRRIPNAPGALTLGAACALVGPISLYVISRVAHANVFSDRYLITSAIGIALIAAWCVASLAGDQARRFVVLSLLACSLLLSFSFKHGNEGWRSAATRVNELVAGSREPVLVQAGFVESAQIDWLRDPYRASYLTAPTSLYPMDGQTIALPYLYSMPARDYLEGLIPGLETAGTFILVTRSEVAGLPLWFDGRLAPDGFTSVVKGRYESVVVREYKRGG